MALKYQEDQEEIGSASLTNCSDIMIENKITFKIFPQCLILANIDECAEKTCSDHGECVDGIKDYTCKCTDGYEGKDCGSKYALDNILWCYRGLIEDTLHSFCFLILKIVRKNTALFDIPILWSHFMTQNGKVICKKKYNKHFTSSCVSQPTHSLV